jgi:hypothetical protein
VTFAQDQSRQQYISELVETLGIKNILEQGQINARKQAQARLNQIFAQISSTFAGLAPEAVRQLRSAADQYVERVSSSYDINGAAAAWGRFYAAGLTDEELKRMVTYSRSSLGSKEMRANTSAASKWLAYIQQKRAATTEEAMTDFIAEIKLIMLHFQSQSKQQTPSPSPFDQPFGLNQ